MVILGTVVWLYPALNRIFNAVPTILFSIVRKTKENVMSGVADIKSMRDDIRGKIFSTKQKKILTSFNGAQIELRQPNLKTVLENLDNADRKNTVVTILIDYAYVPGTDERIFEDTDFDSIMELPFGSDFMEVSEAIDKLTNLNKKVGEERKN